MLELFSIIYFSFCIVLPRWSWKRLRSFRRRQRTLGAYQQIACGWLGRLG